MKVNDKVKAIKNHSYLDISKRHVGIVKTIEGKDVSVQFKHKTFLIVFLKSELKLK
jgi:hypothetical protein